jgi:hypothetical protein
VRSDAGGEVRGCTKESAVALMPRAEPSPWDRYFNPEWRSGSSCAAS